MKDLHSKRVIALYETRMSVRYVVAVLVMYFFAAVLWFILEAILPYTATVSVSTAEESKLTREEFTASAEQLARDESEKERVFLMPSGEDSFCRRLRLVEDAKESIDHIVYESYNEDFSEIFYASLLRAADRGVHVRILVDGKIGRLTGRLSELGTLLQNHNNIEFYHYNETDLLDPASLLVFMHDKVMLADGSIAIVGGVNMGRHTYTENYDMEVMITNSGADGCAGGIKRYYDKMVASPVTRRIVSQNANTAAKQQYIDKFLRYFEASGGKNKKIDYAHLGVPVNKITYLTNGAEGKKKRPIIYKAIVRLAESSESTTIVTPYVLLQGDKKREIIGMAAKNKKFTIVTNSLYNTKNVGYADYYHTRKAYLNNNITLMEYQADNQLHAKIYTFDGKYSIIGSFNLDERSSHIDTESVVIIDSEQFTALVDEYIDKIFIKNSLQVGKNNEYVPSDSVIAGEASTGKHILYGILRALALIRCVL